MYKAEIRIRYPSPSFAKSVRDALSPDDKMGGGTVRVSSNARGQILRVRVGGANRIETLQATVQDIFRCINAAETSLMQLIKNQS
jgi:tRNA threonylcarbamoyladenosine modification (KEOPS) complex  Pcc1 subunit